MSATLLRHVALFWVAGARTHMRGVDPGMQAKYEGGSSFKCFDGTAEVPLKSVNDDFCDCPDGSDEPGTGACAGVDGALFHCRNSGATPQLIYSSRVDDGVCDCCDGSDELGLAARRPGKGCTDTCREEGAKNRKERSDRMAKLKVGLEKKATIISSAEVNRVQWQAELAKLKADLPGLEAELEEAKKVEAEANAKSADSVALQAEVESLRKQVADLQKEVADLKEKLQAATAGGEAGGEGEAKAAGEKKVVSEYAKWMENAGSTPGAIENPSEEEPAGAAGGFEEDEDEDDQPGPTRPISSTASSSKAPAVTEAERKLRENREESGKLQKKIDQVADSDKLGFASLQDQCISKHDGQYNYKLCFFDDAKQDHVLLGRWDAWTGPKVAMFKHGHMCPGGPERELKVIFECGSEEELLDIAEPSRCAYEARVSHPGACSDADMGLLMLPPVRHPKDEL